MSDTMFLKDRAIAIILMTLQKCLLERKNFEAELEGFEFVADGSRLDIMNPPAYIKIPEEDLLIVSEDDN